MPKAAEPHPGKAERRSEGKSARSVNWNTRWAGEEGVDVGVTSTQQQDVPRSNPVCGCSGSDLHNVTTLLPLGKILAG